MKTFLVLLLAGLTLFAAGCKKAAKNNPQSLTAKIICGDCTFVLQKGSKPLVNNKPRGRQNESINVDVKKGDTLLFFGYNYSASVNMDGYLLKGTTELKHGVTHCGGNPTFFMEYIVP